MLESVARSGSLVTVEEGTLTGGVGAEIAARVQSEAWDDLRRPVERVAARDGIIPAAPKLEEAVLPGVDDVVSAVRALGMSGADGCSSSSSPARTRTPSGHSSSNGSSRGERVRAGQPVCVLETSKAPLELESPDDGTLGTSMPRGPEVELGGRSRWSPRARMSRAEVEAERGGARARRAAGPESATRRAVELAEGTGSTSRDREAGLHHRGATSRGSSARVPPRRSRPRRQASRTPLEGVTFPTCTSSTETEGQSTWSSSSRCARTRTRSGPSPSGGRSRATARRRVVGEGVGLGEGTIVIAPRIVLEDGVRIGEDGTSTVWRTSRSAR